MKFLILFTGGTIGSAAHEGVTGPDQKTIENLLDSCIPACSSSSGEPLFYDIRTPYFILSETLDAEHLNLLSQTLSDNLHKGYDGILVTHGSDTLCYAAAILDLMFFESPVPIVLTASNYPLSDPRANGKANFKAALAFLCQTSGMRGVYTAYRNTSDPHNTVCIHKGSRLLHHAECSGDLHSLSGEPFAHCRDGIIQENKTSAPSSPDALSWPAGRTVLSENPGILQIACAPGVSYPACTDEIRTVILLPYHSGTLPVNDPALIRLCTSCREKDIPVYVPAGGCETVYETMQAYPELGIRPVPESAVSLFAKLWIRLSAEENPDKA